MARKFKAGDKVSSKTGLRGEVLRAFGGKILLRFNTDAGQVLSDWFSIGQFVLAKE